MNKLAGVEILRFAAALTVLIAHYNHLYIYGYTPEHFSISGQPFYRFLHPFYDYGTRAVEVFWCISGFIFCYKYGESIRRKRVPPGRFFWLRFSRLYPLHFLTLLAVALLQWIYRAKHGTFFVTELNDARHFVLNLFFASNWGFQRGESFNAPVWSISLEVLAYAFFYVATYLFGVTFFMTVLWLAACVVGTQLMGGDAVFLRCLFYFYLGCLSCLAYQWIAPKGRLWQLPVTLAGVALIVLCTRRFQSTGNLDLWLLDCDVPLLLLLFALNSNLLSNRLGAVADTLGNLTYASYLTHFPFQLAVMLLVGAFGVDHRFAASGGFFIFYLGAVLALSYWIYNRVERPAQSTIRGRFISEARPAR